MHYKSYRETLNHKGAIVEWLCVHSSGQERPEGRDRSSGLLVMLSRRHFMDLCLVEHIPGRLLQVQAVLRTSRLPITIVAVYQHVWRTHLPATENHKLRNDLWDRLSAILARIPLRHHLILCVDMNSTLKPQSPHVGPASTPSDAYNHSAELQSLVADNDLCVLNTWHCSPRQTYFSATGASQIDFILTRRGEAMGPAKLAGPLHQCPVGAWRETGHYPVQAALPFLPYGPRPRQAATARPLLNTVALQESVQANDSQAAALRAVVGDKLSQLPAALDLVQLRNAINDILLNSVCEAFPTVGRSDHRACAQGAFRASAQHTWSLYRQAKQPGPRSLQRLLHQWRCLVLFRQASQALRKQSRQIKKDFHLQQIAEAEQAAANKDQRGMYSVIRRLKSKGRQRASRMANPDQTPGTPEQELQAVLLYSKSTFSCLTDAQEPPSLLSGLSLSDAAYAAQLQGLGLRKAVPEHIAPTAIWKLCASEVSAILSPALSDALRGRASASIG